MANPEIDRLRHDLARAKDRVAEMERGERGVRPPSEWRQETNGTLPGHARAFGRQLLAQRNAVARLESELVNALLPTWTAARVLAAMEPPPPAIKA